MLSLLGLVILLVGILLSIITVKYNRFSYTVYYALQDISDWLAGIGCMTFIIGILYIIYQIFRRYNIG